MESCNAFAKSHLRGIGANFVLQSTNAQGLGTRLVHNYVHKVEVHQWFISVSSRLTVKNGECEQPAAFVAATQLLADYLSAKENRRTLKVRIVTIKTDEYRTLSGKLYRVCQESPVSKRPSLSRKITS